MFDNAKGIAIVRAMIVAMTTVAGIVTIVGSGGGGSADFLGGDPCANGCNFPPIVIATVTPRRSSVQIGTTVVLNASSLGVPSPAYQWQRSIDGIHYADIAGETGSTYTFVARLVDDGTTFGVRVTGTGGVQAVASAYLVVSSSPPVTFADTEFADGDWSATTTSTSTMANVVSQGQAASGGNPGAWRRTVVSLPQGTNTIDVFNISRTATFDPASRGALRAIDYSEDCSILSSTPSTFSTSILLVQNGRSFAMKTLFYCNSPGWVRATATALAVGDFTQVAGPACTANEICPDFSANGTPIKVGHLLTTSVQGSAAVASFERGIDNWKAVFWLR